MNADFVRLIDSIHRDKGIDKEVLFGALEEALLTAIAKRYDVDDVELSFNRETGELDSNYEIQFEELGRILAQTVKQAFNTKVREAERDVMFVEYEEKIGDIITGSIQRFEGDSVVVQVGKLEGILPRSEKVRGESYHIGERIRALILEVKKVGLKVKVILSRSSTGLVRRLFELEVPEIADEIIDIRKLEREPGYRTKIAVTSSDARVDCVGACVGVRGTRIKSIIDELGGERIDIIRWNDDPKQMLQNALQPAEVSHIQLDSENHKALVLVEEDQLSLAIGRKGQNVRLASKLCGWDIDIMTRAELIDTLDKEDAAEAGSEGKESSSESSLAAEALAETARDGSTGGAAAQTDGENVVAAEPVATGGDTATPEAGAEGQDAGKQDAGEQDAGEQDAGKQDAGKQDATARPEAEAEDQPSSVPEPASDERTASEERSA
ncbi:MAG: transcription termination factor NusA [Planctomycetota bacterium]